MADRITMADVARAAGVSMMTVSRVINDKEDVSDSTRHRVLEAVERLGYRPSGIARGLATQRTGTLGLVVPDVSNPFFADVARGIEDEAYAAGYNVFLCNTNEDPQREMAVLVSLEEKRVDGVVLCSSRLEEATLHQLVRRHPAVVLVNRALEGDNVTAALIDDATGGCIAVQHLLRTGQRAIGFLAGPPTSHSGRQRARGYRAALEMAGLSYNPEWVCHCLPTVAGGEKAAREILSTQPELTSLFCYNDLVAVGVLQACKEMGRCVPDDLGVVGFDDIALSALVTPPLTTCRVARYELGARSTELLLKQIDGCQEGCEPILVQPELVIRASAPL